MMACNVRQPTLHHDDDDGIVSILYIVDIVLKTIFDLFSACIRWGYGSQISFSNCDTHLNRKGILNEWPENKYRKFHFD